MLQNRLVTSTGLAAIVAVTVGAFVQAREPSEPPVRPAANEEMRQKKVLIAPLEPGDTVERGGWRMANLQVKTAENVEARTGHGALFFEGSAEIPGAKGDFSVHGHLAGTTRELGLWFHLDEDANIEKLGIQVYDAQGEALLMQTPANWTGWKWVAFATGGPDVRQAYPQPEKNGVIDHPLKSQQVIWFAKAAGATRLVVDGMVASVDRSGLVGAVGVTVEARAPVVVEPGRPLPIKRVSIGRFFRWNRRMARTYRPRATAPEVVRPSPLFGLRCRHVLSRLIAPAISERPYSDF